MSTNSVNNSSLSLNAQSIKVALRYLKKKYLLISLAVLLGLAFAIFYCTIKKPVYTANLTFSMEGEDNSSGGSIMSLAAQFGLDLGGSGVGGIFEGDNIIELFKSRRIIETALLQPYAESNKSYADEFLDVAGFRPSTEVPPNMFPVNSNKPFTRAQDSVMGKIHEAIASIYLEVGKPDIKLNIYTMSFESLNENFSKAFTELLIKEVTKFYVDSKTKRARYNVEVLQKRTDSIKNAFDMALYGRAGIIDANLNPAFQTPMVGAQQKQTDITVLGTAYGELLKNLEIAKYSLLKATPYIQIIDGPRYPLDKRTYPWYLYVPLAMIGSFFLACMGLLGLRLLQKIYQLYLK